MADEAPSSSTGPQEDLAVDVSVVSPSVSVNAPLHFPRLLPSTTIGQVKQKIRDSLDSKPSNEHQRLIHQGKLLGREQDTLLQVFGEQKVSKHLSFGLGRNSAFFVETISQQSIGADVLLIAAPRIRQPHLPPGPPRTLPSSPRRLSPIIEPEHSATWTESCENSHSWCAEPLRR